MSKEGFLKEGRAKGREITCQFWTLNTIYLLAIIDENWIQETRTSVVVLSIVLWMSLATCQEKMQKRNESSADSPCSCAHQMYIYARVQKKYFIVTRRYALSQEME